MPNASESVELDSDEDALTLDGCIAWSSSIAVAINAASNMCSQSSSRKHVATIVLDILNHTEDRSYHDQNAGRVQEDEHSSQRDRSGSGCWRPTFAKIVVRLDDDDNEVAEDSELDS